MLFRYTLQIIGSLAIMFYVSPKLGGVLVAVIPLVGILAQRYGELRGAQLLTLFVFSANRLLLWSTRPIVQIFIFFCIKVLTCVMSRKLSKMSLQNQHPVRKKRSVQFELSVHFHKSLKLGWNTTLPSITVLKPERNFLWQVVRIICLNIIVKRKTTSHYHTYQNIQRNSKTQPSP